MALDAAQPFDFEHKAVQTLKKQRMLKIGIIGFGTFGQFLAKRLVLAGHEVSFSIWHPPPSLLPPGSFLWLYLTLNSMLLAMGTRHLHACMKLNPDLHPSCH